MKVCIDPGHAPGSANGGFGYLEHAGMWKLSNYLLAALERCKVDAVLTRAENENPSLTMRGYTARGCDLFISEHSNAANGIASGVEAYYSVQVPSDEKLAAAITAAEASAMNSMNRGAKTRESTNAKGYDYYSVMYAAREVLCPHVLLVESGFHDNERDAAFLTVDGNLKILAEIQCMEICHFFGMDYITEYEALDDGVISLPVATFGQAEAWARSKGATEIFVSLAKKYYDLSSSHGGVNSLLAFVQSALETGYGNFRGVLDESYCNPCGLKTREGGGDYDKSAHHKFANWEEGVKAHLDHLALYAGADGYPRVNSPDPRHFTFLAGTGRTIAAMSRSWCPSNSNYGGILKRMIREVESTATLHGNINIHGRSYNLAMSNNGGVNYATIKDIAEVVPGLMLSVRKVFEDNGYTVKWDDKAGMILVS